MTVQSDGTVRHEVVVDLPLELTFDPPHIIAFSWDIGPDWQVVSDLALASEVEITFTGEGDDRTRVILVHRHIERHGEGWEALQAGLDSPDAWPLYLSRYEALTLNVAS